MLIPGLGPVALPVPVAHSSREPEGWETDFFESEPASMWNEHWVGVDLEAAQRYGGQMIEAFRALRRFPAL